MKKLIVLFSSICLFSSCATILDGSKTRVHVYGMPNDAKIYYNGAYQGTGKETVVVQKSAVRNGTGKITVSRDGYESAEITLNKKTRVGFVVLDVVFGILPLLVDVATGNLIAARPGNVEYNLIKKPKMFVEPNQYFKQLIGKKVKFKTNDNDFEGIVIESYENKEINIKYLDNQGKVLNIWKKTNDFIEIQ